MGRTAFSAIGGVLALYVFGATGAQATRPLLSHRAIGCVIGGAFVPYAGQAMGSHFRRPQKLPYWVGKSGGRKAEGKEIVMTWHAFSARLPNYAPANGGARWEETGPCQRDRLTTEPPESD